MLPATPYSAASPLFDINHIAALQSEQLQTSVALAPLHVMHLFYGNILKMDFRSK